MNIASRTLNDAVICKHRLLKQTKRIWDDVTCGFWKGILKLNFKSHSIASFSSFIDGVYIADDSWISLFSSRLLFFFIFFLLFQAVLKNGVISGSGFMNSGNVRCGNSVCRPISGVFAKNPLANGYVHVTTIPAGASNITITELRNSINFLGKLHLSTLKIFSNTFVKWREKWLQTRLSEKQFCWMKLNFVACTAPSTAREQKVNNLMK